MTIACRLRPHFNGGMPALTRQKITFADMRAAARRWRPW
jgi:hypothetical protein